MDKNNLRKVLGGLLISGLLLGGTGIALADSADPTSAFAGFRGCLGAGKGIVKSDLTGSVLNSLVSAGTLTQEQADQITAAIKERQDERLADRAAMQGKTRQEIQSLREENRASKVGLIEELIDEGVIAQEQADAIRDAMQAERREQRQSSGENVLAALVQKGTITSEQSTAIQNRLAALQSARQTKVQNWQGMSAKERLVEREKIRNMSTEERQAYWQSQPNVASCLDELVADGTLTQNQADQVKQALGFPNGMKIMQPGPGKMRGEMKGPGPQATN